MITYDYMRVCLLWVGRSVCVCVYKVPSQVEQEQHMKVNEEKRRKDKKQNVNKCMK